MKDPQRLATLYVRGEHARRAAAARALSACDKLASQLIASDDRPVDQGSGFTLGLSRVGPGEDVSTTLFTRAFADRLTEVLRRQAPHPFGDRVAAVDVGQSDIRIETKPGLRGVTWAVHASWDGAVAAGAAYPQETYLQEEWLVEDVAGLWNQVLEATRVLGAVGDHFVAFRLKTNEQRRERPNAVEALPLIRRGPVAAAPDNAGRAHLVRELKRIAGYGGLVSD